MTPTIVWRIGFAASLAMLVSVAAILFTLRSWTTVELPNGLGNSGFAMQMARQPWPEYMLEPGDNRAVMSRQQYIDFGFIASYMVAFLSIALLAMRSERRWIAALGVACLLLAITTAAFDIGENLAILGVTLHRDASAWAHIRPRSLVKWGCSFALILGQAPFYLTTPRAISRILGFAAIVVGSSGLVSVLARCEKGIELSSLLLFLLMVLLPVFFWTGGRAAVKSSGTSQ